MKSYNSDEIRNVALVSHSGAGKTSLTEALLFSTGATDRMGKVEDGSTTTDYDSEEIKRKISINTALAPCIWQNKKINFLDTPGYADFIGEVVGALRACDLALVVVDAVSGVEVQTEKVWRLAEEDDLPRAIFMNRLDKENANFKRVLSDLEEVFGKGVMPLQIPWGQESDFKGLVDVLSMKAYEASGGKEKETPIPDDLKAEAEEYRERLIEKIAESDDALLEKYLEGTDLSAEELAEALKAAVVAAGIFPVLLGSAANNVGSQGLLEAIIAFGPSPADRGPIKGTNPNDGSEDTREPNTKSPLTALVFKTMADPYVGRLSYIRVYSGTLQADSNPLNSGKEERERLGHLLFLRGKNQEDVKEAQAGDIVVAPKLAQTTTGDTLCDAEQPFRLEPLRFPEPLLSMAVQPKTKGDEEKLSTSLGRVTEEDLTIRRVRNSQTRETVLSGMGDLHLEVVLERLKEKFGVEAVLTPPKIPYKETIRVAAKAQGKYKKQTGGRGQYGDVWLELAPQARGAGFEFVDKIVGGSIPRQYVAAVEKGIREVMENGVVAGYQVIDVKATVYDGSFHPVDSSEMAFKIAASMSFKKAFEEATPVLLEPIMKVEVLVPEEYTGDIIGDLSSKRGKILGMEPHGQRQVVKALVPLSEIVRFSTEVRSITHGKGDYSQEFQVYEEMPPESAQKVITAAQQQDSD